MSVPTGPQFNDWRVTLRPETKTTGFPDMIGALHARGDSASADDSVQENETGKVFWEWSNPGRGGYISQQPPHSEPFEGHTKALESAHNWMLDNYKNPNNLDSAGEEESMSEEEVSEWKRRYKE
jgi:hypothetical protein